MLHVTMDPGAKSWAHSVPRDHTCQIYVRRGQLTIVPTEEGLYDGEEDQMPQVFIRSTFFACNTSSRRFGLLLLFVRCFSYTLLVELVCLTEGRGGGLFSIVL